MNKISNFENVNQKVMKILTPVILLILLFSVACVDSAVKEVSVEQAKSAVLGQKAQFIDVRTSSEFSGEHAQNAISCPLDSLEKDVAKLDKNKPVYVICQSGRRSIEGAKKLKNAGFTEVYSVAGGTNDWKLKGLPLEKP
jgi:rhodanese-related sulfurtransferase